MSNKMANGSNTKIKVTMTIRMASLKSTLRPSQSSRAFAIYFMGPISTSSSLRVSPYSNFSASSSEMVLWAPSISRRYWASLSSKIATTSFLELVASTWARVSVIRSRESSRNALIFLSASSLLWRRLSLSGFCLAEIWEYSLLLEKRPFGLASDNY